MDIKNKNLKFFLQLNLKKKSDNMTLKDFETINTVYISNVNSETGEVEYDFIELKMFLNLEKVIIRDSIISKNDIDVINSLNIKKIEFFHCMFENEEYLENLLKIVNLSFFNCYLDNFDFLKKLIKLEKFVLKKPFNKVIFDFSLISNLVNLEELIIEEVDVINDINLEKIAFNLKRLYLKNVKLNNFNFVNLLPDNSNLLIENIYLNYKDILKNKERLIIYTDYLPIFLEMFTG